MKMKLIILHIKKMVKVSNYSLHCILMLFLIFKATKMNTPNDIQPHQTRKALEEVNNHIKVTANRVKNKKLHSVHFCCQANSKQSLGN